jgi:hypothetical protein
MAIKPVCNICGNELTDFGGILLSPPDDKNMVRKFHVCKKCYEKIKPKN